MFHKLATIRIKAQQILQIPIQFSRHYKIYNLKYEQYIQIRKYMYMHPPPPQKKINPPGFGIDWDNIQYLILIYAQYNYPMGREGIQNIHFLLNTDRKTGDTRSSQPDNRDLPMLKERRKASGTRLQVNGQFTYNFSILNIMIIARKMRGGGYCQCYCLVNVYYFPSFYSLLKFLSQ